MRIGRKKNFLLRYSFFFSFFTLNLDFHTALAAVYTGPILNILFTSGVSFIVGILYVGPSLVLPKPSSSLWISLVFLIFGVVVFGGIVVGLWYQFRMPKVLGYMLLTYYALFVICLIVNESTNCFAFLLPA